ncbi:oocyte zinc finger protein XlCOF7.1 isoform X1 [Hydra vulgaris]|uniref:Oocyte zinc finger protein XlCOF7.1 isoform X1 n=2 Tax=Hydra vulgaris TaxID=6087 RepID=A0ABM4BH50_HYDVU
MQLYLVTCILRNNERFKFDEALYKMNLHEKDVQPKSWASILKDIEVIEVLNTRVITEKEESSRCYLISFTSWVDEVDLFFQKSLIEEYWKRKDLIDGKIDSTVKKRVEDRAGNLIKNESDDFSQNEESSFECEYKKSFESISIEESTSIEVSSTASSSVEELSAEKILCDEPRDQVRSCKRRKNKTLDDIVRQISALSDQPSEKRHPSLLNERLQTLDKTLSPETLKDLESESPCATSEAVRESYGEHQVVNTYWSAGKAFQKHRFQCQHCDMFFDNEECLTEHNLTHESSKNPTHHCHVCKNSFRNENSLEEHMATNHIYQQNALKCRYCSRLYTHSEKLELHERQHFSSDVSTVPPPLMPLDDDSVEYTKSFRKYINESTDLGFTSASIGTTSTNIESISSTITTTALSTACTLLNMSSNTSSALLNVSSASNAASCLTNRVSLGKLGDVEKYSQCFSNQLAQNGEDVISFRFDKTSSMQGKKDNETIKLEEPMEEDRSSPVYMKQERSEIKKINKPLNSHEVHNCPVCRKSFSLKENMEYHWQEEHGHKYHFTCKVCEKTFMNELELDSHIATHGKNEFFCGICNKNFDRRSTYETHQRTHTVERPFQCNVCFRAFSLRTNLRRHMLTHTEVQLSQYNCHLCLKLFKHPENLAYHMLEQHRLSPNEDANFIREATRYTSFRDRNIFDRFNEKRKLDEDVSVNKEKHHQRNFIENQSGYLTEQKEPQLSPDSFNRRLIQNMKVSPHPLYINKTNIYSDESSKRLEKFRRSPLEFHDSMQYSNKYPSSSSTESSRNLTRPHSPMNNSPTHAVHHHALASKVTTSSVLYHNGNIVSADKMVGVGVSVRPGTECNECGEKFTSASLYDIHMQSHKKQAYTCEKCPKTFTRRNHYEAHMEGHESGKSKSHSCPYCHRLFSMKGNLRRHIRIHTNEAPYECPICFQRFRRSDGLKGHIKRHETLGESCPVDMVPTQAPASG